MGRHGIAVALLAKPCCRPLQRTPPHGLLFPVPPPQVVEVLFRAGHLRVRQSLAQLPCALAVRIRCWGSTLYAPALPQVVIATGTLAQGINMPCRTVVFAGDHLFLNALQFQQMSGRAGRRGFDPLGHIVLFGVGARKVRSLMVSVGLQGRAGQAAACSPDVETQAHLVPSACLACPQISPVPRLLGHFPLTITGCLRALALHHIVAFTPTGAPAGKNRLVGFLPKKAQVRCCFASPAAC